MFLVDSIFGSVLNSSSQFLQSNDMRVTEVRHGFAKVEMIIDEQILNIHGGSSTVVKS